MQKRYLLIFNKYHEQKNNENGGIFPFLNIIIYLLNIWETLETFSFKFEIRERYP